MFLKKIMNLFNPNQDALKEAIAEGAMLVDVRTPNEFSGGHVAGSVNIPLDKLAQNLKKFEGKKNIVVFCQSGMRSGQAKSILNQNGYQNVINGGSWLSVNNLV